MLPGVEADWLVFLLQVFCCYARIPKLQSFAPGHDVPPAEHTEHFHILVIVTIWRIWTQSSGDRWPIVRYCGSGVLPIVYISLYLRCCVCVWHVLVISVYITGDYWKSVGLSEIHHPLQFHQQCCLDAELGPDGNILRIPPLLIQCTLDDDAPRWVLISKVSRAHWSCPEVSPSLSCVCLGLSLKNGLACQIKLHLHNDNNVDHDARDFVVLLTQLIEQKRQLWWV